MDEKRKLKRRHLIYYLRTYDRTTQALLGHLVDITPEGIMLISEKALAVGENYSMRISLPEDIFGKNEIDFEAHSQWCRRDINPDFFDTGFELIELTQADREIIEHMIDNYGFRY